MLIWSTWSPAPTRKPILLSHVAETTLTCGWYYSYMWLMWLMSLRQDTGKCVFVQSIRTGLFWLSLNITISNLMSYGWILANDHISAMSVLERTASLDWRMCCALHVFHAFTGCYIVSSFGERQENSLGHMAVVPKATGAFEDILLLQDGISDQTMSTLSIYPVLVYDWARDITKVNDCRKQLLTRRSRILDNLPPTKAAL